MSSLTLVRRIAARPALVWDALTTAEGLSAWIGPDAGPVLIAENELRVGGSYRLRFRMIDGSEHESVGAYLEIDEPRRLVMSWQWIGHTDDTGSSRIEIGLRPLDDGTELTFTHAQLKDDATRDSHRQGWNGSLDKLEADLTRRERETTLQRGAAL